MTSTVHPHSNGTARFGTGSAPIRFDSLLARVAGTPRLWWKRHQAREELMAMDDRMLADIGLTRGDAVVEWQKAFWEA